MSNPSHSYKKVFFFQGNSKLNKGKNFSALFISDSTRSKSACHIVSIQ